MSKNAVMPLDDYKNACDVIREKTGSTDLIKSGELAAQIDDVYSAGQSAAGGGTDEFWDNFISNVDGGTDWRYIFAGKGWTDNTFNPNKSLIVGTQSQGLFFMNNVIDLAGILERNGIILDTSKVENASAFAQYSKIENFPLIDLSSATNIGNAFGYLSGENITLPLKLNADGSQDPTNMFRGTKTLVNLSVEGTIGQNGFDVSASTTLTHDSLMSIIGALKDYGVLTVLTSEQTFYQGASSLTLDIQNLIEGKTYLVEFYSNEFDGCTSAVFNKTPQSAQVINLNGYGETLGMHYSTDYWSDDNYTFNLVVYQGDIDETTGGYFLNAYRFIENKETGQITDFTEADDKITVYTKTGDGAHSVVLGAENLLKLTDAQKVQATEKGWILE